MIWRCVFLLLALVSNLARADTPLTLFKTFTGNVNFTGTVVSMRTGATACSVYGSTTTLSVALGGIPTTATVLSAQLYWAGSGSTPDYTVGFESGNVTSTAARSYTSQSVGYDYFSGAVDVTSQVIARRNGNYQFYGLSVNSGSPYCAVEAVLSGFTLLVVYSDNSQPYRVLNLYEGFQYYRSTGYTTTMTNFRTPSPLTSATTGRVGHITWEGDGTAGQTGEDISVNGTKMTDTLNPSGNQFNSKSNINGNSTSYGVDFDAYDVASPVIAANQTSVATQYQSGTDMVLLSAQLIAMPHVQAVDLSLSMTRNGAFQTGTAGSYTLSVFNAGPNTEVGPITLVDTLPAGVSYVSAEGTRWSCSASGQVVTCKYNGLFTMNTYLPDITLTVLPTAEGAITNTASVSGVNYDSASANNTDSDTTTVTRGAVTYVFTESACTANVPFTTVGQCRLLTPDQRVPAATSVDGYLTALSNGVPVARSTTAATTVQLNFAITCVLPLKHAGVRATINAVAVPLCADGPGAPAAGSAAWSTAYALVFAANAPSVKITMGYADVGKVLISVKDTAGAVASSPSVIWRPDTLRLAVNGSTTSATSTSAPFLAAGAPFSMKVDALMVNGVAAPNFGNGDAAVTVALPTALPTATADEKLIAAAMGNLPKLETAWPNPASGGAFTGTGVFAEVGVPTLVASVTGGYFGVDDVKTGTLKAGRFYPFSFQTVVAPMFSECTKITKLPVCTTGVRGASYATQNFSVSVIPLDVNGNAVQNFRGVFGDKLDLSAVDSAGSVSALSPGGGALTASTVAALPATGSYDAMVATASYALPVPFNRALPASTAWSPSLPIYLRATAQTAVDSGGKVKLTSKQLDKSLEDGVTILNGRLRLSTVPGSELLRLPVTMDAQFWYKPTTGAGTWTGNLADTGATPTAIAFSACKRNLLVANACYSGLQMTPKDAVFTAGTARFFIAPPGAGRTGSTMFNMTGAPAWLPSTLAQAVFGVYKSNFIYLRELY